MLFCTCRSSASHSEAFAGIDAWQEFIEILTESIGDVPAVFEQRKSTITGSVIVLGVEPLKLTGIHAPELTRYSHEVALVLLQVRVTSSPTYAELFDTLRSAVGATPPTVTSVHVPQLSLSLLSGKIVPLVSPAELLSAQART